MGSRNRLVIPDIFVTDRVMALKVLRCFGHLIVKLYIDYDMFRPCSKMLECYLSDYASESLIQMKLARFYPDQCIFQTIQKPFTNLKSLCIEECAFGRELPFNRIFPNLKSLKLGTNKYKCCSAIRLHFSVLTDLALHDDTHSLKKFDQSDVKELLKLNPQLEKLELCLSMEFGPQFVTWIKEACPNLQHLGLGCSPTSLSFTFLYSETCHFNQIEKFTLNNYTAITAPFTFSKLKYLELGVNWTMCNTFISELIVKNPHLISLTLELSSTFYDLHNLFRMEHLLLNIEELRIEILKEDIPSDDLMYFLTQNRSLKRFSLKTMSWHFHEVYNAIISGNNEFKIRHKAIEFNITRTADNYSKKFVFRDLKMLHAFDVVWECCSYDESRHLLSQKYDEYENGLINVLKKRRPNKASTMEAIHISLMMGDFYF